MCTPEEVLMTRRALALRLQGSNLLAWVGAQFPSLPPTLVPPAYGASSYQGWGCSLLPHILWVSVVLITAHSTVIVSTWFVGWEDPDNSFLCRNKAFMWDLPHPPSPAPPHHEDHEGCYFHPGLANPPVLTLLRCCGQVAVLGFSPLVLLQTQGESVHAL